MFSQSRPLHVVDDRNLAASPWLPMQMTPVKPATTRSGVLCMDGEDTEDLEDVCDILEREGNTFMATLPDVIVSEDSKGRRMVRLRQAGMLLLMLVVMVYAVSHVLASEVQPNPPAWPETVRIFSPEDDPSTISSAVNAAYSHNGGQNPQDNGQWSSSRFAFLFKPGKYNVDVPVGYYTQVAGLGDRPEDVEFESDRGVYCEEGAANPNIGALNTFWRTAENFKTKAYAWGGMLWAVSQGVALRRVIVDGNLLLSQQQGAEMGRASGGFMADTKVSGLVVSGSQQQWLARNSEVGAWQEVRSWNQVFVGTEGAPGTACGQARTTVDYAERAVEKPFISVDEWGKYHLNIPQQRMQTRGASFDEAGVKRVGFENVYVASPGESAGSINARLSAGLHVVLSPGIYKLDAALSISQDNQVLLGLGMATLIPTAGNAAIEVGNVDGVRIAGVLLEAGEWSSSELLVWGNPNWVTGANYAGSAENPGALHDVHIRVGGPSHNEQADTLLRLRSGNIIGDNMWLWRADHGDGYETKHQENPSVNGAVIEGNDVTMYGLFAEHHLGDQVQWTGDRGAVYLLQMELPYDAKEDFGTSGKTGLRVSDAVTSFKGYGVGVYHYFRDHPVHVASGIVAPQALEASFVSPLSKHLAGQGVMDHVLNDKGAQTPSGPMPSYVC